MSFSFVWSAKCTWLVVCAIGESMNESKPREWAIHTAAQCWCDAETEMIEMDTRLAYAFAKRLDAVVAERDQALELLREAREKLSALCDNWNKYYQPSTWNQIPDILERKVMHDAAEETLTKIRESKLLGESNG